MQKKLNITLVMDQYGETSNGTTVTARRLAENLTKRGHHVRIVTSSQLTGEDVFVVKKFNVPILRKIIASQGMQLAIPEKSTMIKAFEKSDVVHFLMPFRLSRKGKELCDKMGIASTAAFHVQPENITSTLSLGKFKPLTELIYHNFRGFYNKFTHVHCPSLMIKHELEKRKYTAKMHVISNGIVSDFKHEEAQKPDELRDKYIILMIARLSKEKRQDLLIKAIGKSKYNDKIQLIFCGKGPWKAHLQKLSEKYLKNSAVFKFVSQDELRRIINYSDLYVHSSDIDIEAIGCMEAFACGLVPIISDNKLVATNQFALNKHCLFKSGDPTDLREKIEYMIEHTQFCNQLRTEYVESSKKYAIEKCIDQMEEMFYQAYIENQQKYASKSNLNNPLYLNDLPLMPQEEAFLSCTEKGQESTALS